MIDSHLDYLTVEEFMLRKDPVKLAGLHWQLTGEAANPYPRGSLEQLEYTNAFQKLAFNFDQQPI